MAYPIYLTIGNIPKDIRRKPSRHAQLLLGYIPTTKLGGMSVKAARRRALANLFHLCMHNALGPISSYGESGLPMMSGDGIWRRCHPIFSVFVGDYPEQALVTCTYNGRCPKCFVTPSQLGNYATFPSRTQDAALDAYQLAGSGNPAFHATCRELGLKPVFHPFWESFPLTDIFVSITPDILHQLLQGMMKHLIGWLVGIFGPAAIDARCKAIPPSHKILLFTKGIATLSRISGHEHKKMCSILLGLVVDLPIPGGRDSSRVIKAVRALLDFLFLAQFPSHTSDTIRRLEDCLSAFHNNKEVFIDLGVRENFNIPKLHSLAHYAPSIRLFGTTDNYNTEQSERLHIDFTKDAYRATNHKDEYSQMTVWLERREKVQRHATYIKWRQEGSKQSSLATTPIGPPHVCPQRIKMAQNPSVKAVSLPTIPSRYCAVLFQDALGDFIASINNPGLTGNPLHARGADTLIPFRTVPVFHYIKFTSTRDSSGSEIMDVIHARPEQRDSRGRVIPSRFDTVLVRGKDHNQGNKCKSSRDLHRSRDLTNSTQGLRIAQVRIVFQIPKRSVGEVFLSQDITPPTYLVYVEWFTPLPATPDPKHGMYKVSRLPPGRSQHVEIIPVDAILGSVHLFPRFGPVSTQELNSFTSLDRCNTFYLNPFTDQRSYMLFG